MFCFSETISTPWSPCWEFQFKKLPSLAFFFSKPASIETELMTQLLLWSSSLHPCFFPFIKIWNSNQLFCCYFGRLLCGNKLTGASQSIYQEIHFPTHRQYMWNMNMKCWKWFQQFLETLSVVNEEHECNYGSLWKTFVMDNISIAWWFSTGHQAIPSEFCGWKIPQSKAINDKIRLFPWKSHFK